MTSNKAAALSGLDPLKDLLGDVLVRLEALEAKLGGGGGSSSMPMAGVPPAPPKSPHPVKATIGTSTGGESPAVKAYDVYMKEAVIPFASTCDALGGLPNVGKLLQDAFEGVRFVIVLAARSKPPAEELGVALPPHLTQTTDAVKQIREMRLARDWDRHHKAIIEMLACLSWILYKPPATPLPAPYVREVLGSAEFWSNRIRKEYKGHNDTQIAFCDNLKKLVNDLAAYIQEHHATGLAFNPRGVSLAEASIRLLDEGDNVMTGAMLNGASDVMKSPVQKRHPTLGAGGGGANLTGLMGELNKRKSADGSSAATGLKHVTKDQQTWRKEFKKPDAETNGHGLPSAPRLDPGSEHMTKESKKKTPLRGLPIFEYQDRGFKWIVENQNKETAMKEVSKDGIITIDISDPKQQVYRYNCENVTVKVNGKFKNLILDKCIKCNVVYDTVISSAECVNCKKIQLQVQGVCPAFTIDKTVNILVWLSSESKDVSAFTTSLSSEMNVSFPDGEDQKEMPIPEQFVHRLVNNEVTSEVSDLYH